MATTHARSSRSRTFAAIAAALIIGGAAGLLWRSAAGHGPEAPEVERLIEPTRPHAMRPRMDPPAGPAPMLAASEAAEPDEGAPRNPLMDAPRDELHPRDPDEWQGMLVNTAVQQYCEATDFCGLALSCSPEQRCGPCTEDSQCASGEACVLDHCVIAENVTCRTRSDCAHLGDDALCLLSGLTGGDPRGNADMRSFCQVPAGGMEQVASAERETRRQALLAGQKFEPAVTSDALFERLAVALPAGQ